ncbi:MAG TPA: hypothetical protein VMG63_07230, partial [Terriglobia bacterium]|nr:hypothetical protein [Terriglobia bacterium]
FRPTQQKRKPEGIVRLGRGNNDGHLLYTGFSLRLDSSLQQDAEKVPVMSSRSRHGGSGICLLFGLALPSDIRMPRAPNQFRTID